MDGHHGGRIAWRTTLESRVMRKYHARFGGGPTEKYRPPPSGRPESDGRQLAGGLPYIATWAKDQNTLKNALGKIQKVSATLIERVERAEEYGDQ
jgi:hypothetical protein